MPAPAASGWLTAELDRYAVPVITLAADVLPPQVRSAPAVTIVA